VPISFSQKLDQACKILKSTIRLSFLTFRGGYCTLCETLIRDEAVVRLLVDRAQVRQIILKLKPDIPWCDELELPSRSLIAAELDQIPVRDKPN
jgi:hypothetical protein